MMMKKMMGRWMLVVTVVVGAGPAAAADAPSNTLGDYAILGLKQVTLRGRVNVISGDVGSNAPDGSVTLIDRAKVAASIAANEIHMGRGTSAGGLFCTLLEQQAVKNAPATCVPTAPPLVDSVALPIVQVSPGTQDQRLAKRAVLEALPPGAYNRIKLATGAKLVLAGGDYAVRSIELRPRAQLLCAAACNISVEESVRIREGGELGPVAPLDATGVRVDVKGGGGPFAAFRAYKRSTVSANVYAPGGDVSLGMNGTYTGAFVGENVLVWPGATIEAASAL
jgi:hypothetical protein